VQRPRGEAIAHAATAAGGNFSFLLGRGAFSGFRGYEERDLAFGRVFLKMGEKFGRGAAAEFLEGFGEFSRDADRAIGDDFHEGGEGFFQPVRRLEKNGGFVAGRGFGEFAGATSTFDREESAEEKPVAGKP
jgi:hypothetical protein